MKETQTIWKIGKTMLLFSALGLMVFCRSKENLPKENVIVEVGKVTIMEDSLMFQVNLWRNMMPGFGEGVDRSLRLLIDVKSSVPLANHLTIDSACVVHSISGEKWCVIPEKKNDFGGLNQSFEATGGPGWRDGEGAKVSIYASYKGQDFTYSEKEVKVMFTH